MIYFDKDHYVDVEKFSEDLKFLNYVYIDYDTLDNYIRYATQECATLLYMCSQIIALDSGYRVNNASVKGNVYRYLTEYKGCPEGMFYLKGRPSWSLDSKKVLKKLLDRGFAEEFLELYIETNSKKHILAKVSSILSRLHTTDKKAHNGKDLYRLNFNIAPPTSNLRVYYNNYNIQGIPKKATPCMVAPSGYVIVSGDFAQSDFRIAYNMLLRTEENKNIMDSLNDKYHAFNKLVMGDRYSSEEFLENRDLYKTNTLAPIYGAKSAATDKARNYINTINQYLETNKVYSEYKRRIERKIDLGVPLNVVSYFGTHQLITESTVTKGFERPKNMKKAMLDYALNAPAQTGTSEIVISVTNSVMEHFKEVGYTPENGGIYSYLNRHDEPVFLVSVDALSHSSIFQKHQTVQVGDWMPLALDFKYTDAYNTYNESIQKYAERFYLEEVDVLPVKNKVISKTDYFIPTADIFEISIGYHDINNALRVISFYDYKNQKCSFQIQEGVDSNATYEIVVNKIGSMSEAIKSNDNDVAYACSQLSVVDKQVFSNGILIVMTRNYENSLLLKANVLAEHIAVRYANKNNIIMRESDLCRNSSAFIQSVLDNGEVF